MRQRQRTPGDGSICLPRHKSLEWLKRHQQHTIQKQLLEMFAVSGLQMTEIAPGNEDDAQIGSALMTAIFWMKMNRISKTLQKQLQVPFREPQFRGSMMHGCLFLRPKS